MNKSGTTRNKRSRKSKIEEKITCLICDKELKLLKTHLKRTHHMDPETYRAKFDLPEGYSMIAGKPSV